MPPMSGPLPTQPGQQGLPTAPSDPTSNARSEGNDLALRQQLLLKQCDSLAEQVSQLGYIAPFAQDDILAALSGLQGLREKLLTQLGAEIEQAQAGNAMSSETPQPGSSAEMASY